MRQPINSFIINAILLNGSLKSLVNPILVSIAQFVSVLVFRFLYKAYRSLSVEDSGRRSESGEQRHKPLSQGAKREATGIATTPTSGTTIDLPQEGEEQRPGVTLKGHTCRLLLIPWSLQCDACSRRCCASRSNSAIFSSFAATEAQPSAVPSQR